uniref:HTH La-type RNA-binding domain-containing protein n=1 Tax=Macrostomum lignano TaxID=282301 RepID=A0A1I8JPX6_9PLAT
RDSERALEARKLAAASSRLSLQLCKKGLRTVTIDSSRSECNEALLPAGRAAVYLRGDHQSKRAPTLPVKFCFKFNEKRSSNFLPCHISEAFQLQLTPIRNYFYVNFDALMKTLQLEFGLSSPSSRAALIGMLTTCERLGLFCAGRSVPMQAATDRAERSGASASLINPTHRNFLAPILRLRDRPDFDHLARSPRHVHLQSSLRTGQVGFVEGQVGQAAAGELLTRKKAPPAAAGARESVWWQRERRQARPMAIPTAVPVPGIADRVRLASVESRRAPLMGNCCLLAAECDNDGLSHVTVHRRLAHQRPCLVNKVYVTKRRRFALHADPRELEAVNRAKRRTVPPAYGVAAVVHGRNGGDPLLAVAAALGHDPRHRVPPCPARSAATSLRLLNCGHQALLRHGRRVARVMPLATGAPREFLREAGRSRHLPVADFAEIMPSGPSCLAVARAWRSKSQVEGSRAVGLRIPAAAAAAPVGGAGAKSRRSRASRFSCCSLAPKSSKALRIRSLEVHMACMQFSVLQSAGSGIQVPAHPSSRRCRSRTAAAAELGPSTRHCSSWWLETRCRLAQDRCPEDPPDCASRHPSGSMLRRRKFHGIAGWCDFRVCLALDRLCLRGRLCAQPIESSA